MLSISHSPNSNWKQQLLALKLLVLPWNWFAWKQGKGRTKLQQALSALHENAHVSLTNTGRDALYLALKALNIKQGDEVIIQAYTCIVVPNAVIWNGAKPIYVDIDASYNLDPDLLEQAITENTKAIIVQHTFGYPADMTRISKIASERNIPIVEDCAHSLGAKSNGKPVGTIGDVSILSFGRDKMISSVSGGAIMTTNEVIQQRIEQLLSNKPYPTNAFVLQNLLHPILLPAMARMIGNLKIGQLLIYLTQKLRLLNKVYRKNECNTEPPKIEALHLPNAMAVLAHQQLADLETTLSKRKEHAKAYTAFCQKNALSHQQAHPNTEPSYLRFTIEVENPKKMRENAYRNGFILGNWYNAPIMPKPQEWALINYKLGAYENAEELVNHNLNLPTMQKLSERSRSKLLQALKSGE